MKLIHAPHFPELALDAYIGRIRALETTLKALLIGNDDSTIVVPREELLLAIGTLVTCDNTLRICGQKLETLRETMIQMDKIYLESLSRKPT